MIMEDEVRIHVVAGRHVNPQFADKEQLVGEDRRQRLHRRDGGRRPVVDHPVRQFMNEVKEVLVLRHADH